MPKGPAARVGDPVLHPLPPVLQPGPGSFNVIIGGMPGWRGVSPAAAAAVGAAKSTSDAAIKTAEVATAGAAGTPALPGFKTAEELVKTTAATTMGSMITGSAGGADIHICATPLPIPPHGPGVVIDGSTTVFTNSLAACRQMDTIMEALGPPNKIAIGCLTVIIGDQPGATNSFSTGLGAAIDAEINKSDSLVAALERLKAEGWKIQYGVPGKGTFANRSTKTIVVDPNQSGSPTMVTQSVAHEAGHAMYTMDPQSPMGSKTKDQYVKDNLPRNLKDEGEATMFNAQVRNEIKGKDGTDIGVAGQQGEKYQTIAESDHDYADRDKQRDQIGKEFGTGENTSTSGQTYNDYYKKQYEDAWDKAHPPPAGP